MDNASRYAVVCTVYQLYNAQPYQCSTCATRFRDQKSLDVHMDEHFRINSRKWAMRGKPVSRSWFPSASGWVDENTALDLCPGKPPLDRKQVPPQTVYRLSSETFDSASGCCKCGELFEENWDSELQLWMFENAVNYHGQPCHPECLPIDLSLIAQPRAGSKRRRCDSDCWA